MTKLIVNTKKSYPIYIEDNLLSTGELIIQHCQRLANTWIIIADAKLTELYAKPLLKKLQQTNSNTYLLNFPACEANKTREQKQLLEDELLRLGCGRDICLIALGGGVTTDLVGFLAATFCRGIPVIYIPTSLLAMVDASIGGKTGVNTPVGKNLIGCFYQPNAVFIDPTVLKTLPKNLFCDGIAEVIKHALLADPQLIQLLQQQAHAILNLDTRLLIEMITRSLQVKKHIVEQDETETTGLRQLLNLGHTVAHALEATSNYELSHGQAVALGLMIETQIGIAANISQPSLLKIIHGLLTVYQLPTHLLRVLSIAKLFTAMQHDKKNKVGNIHFILLTDCCQPYIKSNQCSHPVSQTVITTVLENINFSR